MILSKQYLKCNFHHRIGLNNLIKILMEMLMTFEYLGYYIIKRFSVF